MAIAQAAAAAGTALVKYAPEVYDKGMKLVDKATNGRVKNAADIVPFVKNDVRKLSVVTGALASAGVKPDDLVPRDLVALDPQLAQVRSTIERIASNMRDQFDRGSDNILAASQEDIARDVLRRQRVDAVLRVYGTAEAYFLCHPNGGVPRADFSWHKAMNFSR